MRARLSWAAVLALGMLVGGCLDAPSPIPDSKERPGHSAVDRRETAEVANRLFETQFEQARPIELVDVGARLDPAGAAIFHP